MTYIFFFYRVGIITAVLFLVILALISIILYKKGKFERVTSKFCGGDRRNLQRDGLFSTLKDCINFKYF